MLVYAWSPTQPQAYITLGVHIMFLISLTLQEPKSIPDKWLGFHCRVIKKSSSHAAPACVWVIEALSVTVIWVSLLLGLINISWVPTLACCCVRCWDYRNKCPFLSHRNSQPMLLSPNVQSKNHLSTGELSPARREPKCGLWVWISATGEG